MKKQIKIATAEIKFSEEFEGFFESQENAIELHENIRLNGVLVPPVIDSNNILVDGYERVRESIKNGVESIWVFQMDNIATMDDRLNLNLQRSKTEKDVIKEFEFKIQQIKKMQGRKKDGMKSTYAQQISEVLGGRWKDEETINKIIEVNQNDFDNKILTKDILSGKSTPNAAHQFITNTKKIAEEKKCGIVSLVKNGKLSPLEANKILVDFVRLESDTQGTFVIPEKCFSYNIDCTTIDMLAKYEKQVDLIFTSPPYWALKTYDGDKKNQAGKEETKHEFLERLAKMVLAWMITLKDSASVMINIGETYKDGVAQGIPYLLIEYIQRITGLVFFDMLIWSKKNCRSNGNNEDIRPRNNVEYILWFVVDITKVKYKKLTYKFADSKPTLMRGFGGYDRNGYEVKKKIKALSGYHSIRKHISEQEIENIIKCGTGINHLQFKLPKNEHPAVMSALLPICPISMTTEEGDLVFDPFSGTNVVGYISQLLNRRTLTTETSSTYFNEGCNNLQKGVDDYDVEGLKLVNDIAFRDNDQELETAA